MTVYDLRKTYNEKANIKRLTPNSKKLCQYLKPSIFKMPI